GGIVTKVALPRYVVVVAAILNALMTFAISLLILAILLWATGTPPHPTLAVFPVLLVDLVLLTAGISLLLAPLHVRFHDVGYLWSVAIQIGFWLTPIIYHDTMIPERWHWLLTYNPMARIILYSREVVIYGHWPELVGVAKTTIAAACVLI